MADRWIWDFRLARDGESHHLFYQPAPRTQTSGTGTSWPGAIRGCSGAGGTRYGVRLVRTPDGWQRPAWLRHGPDGFVGELADPVPVRHGAGRLALVDDPATH
jgi:hypothetical protein